MKAVYLTGIGKLEMRDIPAPQVQRPDDVLLRVDVVGVCGSDMHYFKEGRIGTTTNRSGGIQGGITNGEPILLRVAFKPTSSIAREQRTVL